MKKYIVELTREERKTLKQLAHTGRGAAFRIQRANILLKVDQGKAGPGPRPRHGRFQRTTYAARVSVLPQ